MAERQNEHRMPRNGFEEPVESMTEITDEEKRLDTAIRLALPEGAPLLSELALRSKGHWGYDAAFLASCRDDLALSPQDVASSPVFVSLDSEGGITGYYRLIAQDGRVGELDALFVEPTAIGRGVGRRLWQHAVDTAGSLGLVALEI